MPTDIQQQIIKELQIPAKFVIDREIRNRIDFLKGYILNNNKKSYVLGISGGIDSTTAGTLASQAVRELRENDYYCEFIAVRLPYGIQKDEDEAQTAIDFIEPDSIFTINIKDATDAVMEEVKSHLLPNERTGHLIDFNKGNIKARQRMIAQYAIAGLTNGIVIGTDHGAEAVMGFFTKFGDGAADILPLSGLTKRRVRAIATALGVPSQLVNKTPTADLEDDRPGLPDEVAHGVTYDQIDDFLEGKDVPSEVHDIIVKAYMKTKHKRELPVVP